MSFSDLGIEPKYVKLFTYDKGETCTSLGLGSAMLRVDVDSTIEYAKEVAGLDASYSVRVLGSATRVTRREGRRSGEVSEIMGVVGIDFKPALSQEQGVVFAAALTIGTGAHGVELCLVKEGRQGSEIISHVPFLGATGYLGMQGGSTKHPG